MRGNGIARPWRRICTWRLGHVLVLRLLAAVLVVVEHIKDRLRVLHLHLLRDVRRHQQLGPRLRHSRELPAVIVEADVDDVGELGRVGDVRLLVVVLRLLHLVRLVLRLLLRLLRQRPHVHRQAHLDKKVEIKIDGKVDE